MAKYILFLLALLLLFYYNEQNIQLTFGCDSIYNVHGMLNIYLILCIVYFRVSQIECCMQSILCVECYPGVQSLKYPQGQECHHHLLSS